MIPARKDRPGLDRLLNDAQRGKFDIVMAWAIDRVGRSLLDLLHTIQHLEACGVDRDPSALFRTNARLGTSVHVGGPHQ
jgi:Resolvase, N terminal domain